jgi:hypothetical protein
MQAFLIDGIILSVGAVSTLIATAGLGLQGVDTVILAGLAVFILEPAMVSFTGGTIGHHLLGLCAVSKKTAKNINIFSAISRFIVKTTFGILSIVPIFTTRQYQAIHDLLIGSIVILKTPQAMRSHEVLGERELEAQGYLYPSKLRRAIIIVLYNLALFVVLEFILVFSLSENCSDNNQCLGTEKLIAYSLTLVWIASIFVSIIMGWKGILLGCRRHLI